MLRAANKPVSNSVSHCSNLKECAMYAAGNQEAVNSLLSATDKIQTVVMHKCLSELNAMRRLGNLAA